MKRILVILAVVAMVMTLGFSISLASDVQLNGRSFVTIIDGQLYTLKFVQGPFGPGEAGNVALTDLLGNSFVFNYQFENPICEIESATFYLVGSQLKYIAPDALTFDEVVPE